MANTDHKHQSFSQAALETTRNLIPILPEYLVVSALSIFGGSVFGSLFGAAMAMGSDYLGSPLTQDAFKQVVNVFG